VVQIPANGRTQPVEGRYRVRAYPVCQSRGFIWLWYGEGGTPTAQPPFFDELADGFSYGEFAETWPVHYTRAIENQLDVVHLPFVHRTTIGRGGKTLVNGPVVRWVGDRMTFYVKNARDLGQRPQRPEEIDGVEHLFSLQLQMPNLWQNRASDRVRIVAAFAPIDEEHTRIYLRFYQKLTAAPGLCQAVNGLGNLVNRTVLHQDRRVVVTQQPVKSALQMGENLLQGDLPIIEYRMKRQEFLEDGTVF
jgi:phenylpropionate dioxygenase-like ring-hydroxylating dioxygenase large terminal subunit